MPASRFDRTADRYAAAALGRDWSDLVAWCEPAAEDRALDVGGGTGALAAALAGRVAEVTVVDVSAAMLRHVEPPAQPVAARAEALPFPDATFDLVTCVGALHHVQSPTRALDEMARVVAPGGRVVLQDFVADPDPTRARRWEEIETLRDPGHNRLLAPGEARSRMLAAGLAVDAEESWVHTSELDAWLHVAGCEGDAATRIRALVGGGGELRMQVGRARFRRPRADE